VHGLSSKNEFSFERRQNSFSHERLHDTLGLALKKRQKTSRIITSRKRFKAVACAFVFKVETVYV